MTNLRKNAAILNLVREYEMDLGAASGVGEALERCETEMLRFALLLRKTPIVPSAMRSWLIAHGYIETERKAAPPPRRRAS